MKLLSRSRARLPSSGGGSENSFFADAPRLPGRPERRTSTSPPVTALDASGEPVPVRKTSPSRPWQRSASRRFSTNSADCEWTRLTDVGRSKTSLGRRTSLSRYTPLPAIGSQLSREQAEGATAVVDDLEESAEESGVDFGNESNDASDADDEERRESSEDCSDPQEATDQERPRLIRSRTFTVLKVDDVDEEAPGDERETKKRNSIAFFISDRDDDGDGQQADGSGGGDGDGEDA